MAEGAIDTSAGATATAGHPNSTKQRAIIATVLKKFVIFYLLVFFVKKAFGKLKMRKKILI
jgi:hypothetical protein